MDKKTIQGLGDAALDATFIGHSVSAVAVRQLRTIIEDSEIISNIDDANYVYYSFHHSGYQTQILR